MTMIRISPPSFPPELVQAMDRAANLEEISRAEFLRRAVRLRMKVMQKKLDVAWLLDIKVDEVEQEMIALYEQVENREITPDSARHLAQQKLGNREES